MRKKHFRALGAITAFAAMMATTHLSALCLTTESELSFSGGWRQDHFRSSATTSVDASNDILRGSCLSIWQVGVQGWLSPCLSECDPWLNNFFARGSAYWGWIDHGIYLHRYTPAPATTVTIDSGDISHGHTWDYTIGGGYLFDCGAGFKIGPSGGYSSNKLTFKAENVLGVVDTIDASTAVDVLAYFDEGALISSKWQGPWVGADALWECNNWSLYASYEYHWTHWKGGYRSPSTDLTDGIHFSDSRKGRKGWGQSAYLGVHYNFCSLLTGVGIKYQYFHTKGSLTPVAAGGFPAVGGAADQVDSITTTWSSVSLLLDIGYAF
jgi:hypothetical protein